MLEELDKLTLLGRAFAGTIVIRATQPRDAAHPVDCNALALQIEQRYDGSRGGEWLVQPENLQLYVAGSLRPLQWVRVSLPEATGLLADTAYALEVEHGASGIARGGFALFCPGNSVQASVGGWNAEVGRRWLAVFQSPEAKAWVDRAHALCSGVLDRMLNVETARRSGGW